MPFPARAGRAAPALIGISAVAGLAAILEPNTFPSYDYAFALASAQDVLEGRDTGYTVPVFAPVPHPLTLVEALAVVRLGDAALTVFSAVALLAFGLLCWSLFQIGSAIASWPVGLLAAAAVFTSPAIFELAARTYGDVVAASLVTAAVALEVARPRRGVPVLVVLGLAGLLRPEAWLLAGAYWLYLAPRLAWRERLSLAALTAVAPLLWMTMDTLLTGDPLHSVEVTRVYTQKADVSVTPDSLWIAVRAMAGWPVLAGAAIGAFVAWRRIGAPAGPPLVAGAAAFLATVAPAVLGESPVLRRYLVVPAAMASLFFAIACLGWTASFRQSARWWPPAGIALLVLGVILLAPERVDRWEQHRRAQAGRVELLEHLRGWVRAPAPRSYLGEAACAPILVPGYGYRPYLRLWLDVPPRDVAFHFGDVTPADGLVLLPTAADGYQRLMLVDVGRSTRNALLSGRTFAQRFRLVARSRRWELFAGPGCRRAVAGRARSARPAATATRPWLRAASGSAAPARPTAVRHARPAPRSSARG